MGIYSILIYNTFLWWWLCIIIWMILPSMSLFTCMFRCKYCGRKFGWKTQLATHENLHTGRGLHHCHICSKSFMTKWILQRHMKVHTKHLSNTSEPPLKRIAFSETCLNQANFNQGLEQRENCFQDSVQSEALDFERSDVDANVLIKPFGFGIHHSSPNDEKIKVGLTCNQCEEKFVSEDKLAFHLLEHNLRNNEKFQCKETDTVTQVEDDSVESCSKSKSNQKVVSKGNLTSIVSKLHHKVDGQQKTDLMESENVSVQVVETSDPPQFVNITLQESVLNEYSQNLNSKSRNVMSKTTDPFISGVTTTDKPSMNHSWTIKQTHDNTGQLSSANEITFLRQQIAKQNSLLSMLKKELGDKCSKNEQEIHSLNKRIDCLTSLVNSQSLILNKIVLGGKMTVSGSLDFAVQQNESRLDS